MLTKFALIRTIACMALTPHRPTTFATNVIVRFLSEYRIIVTILYNQSKISRSIVKIGYTRCKIQDNPDDKRFRIYNILKLFLKRIIANRVTSRRSRLAFRHRVLLLIRTSRSRFARNVMQANISDFKIVPIMYFKSMSTIFGVAIQK